MPLVFVMFVLIVRLRVAMMTLLQAADGIEGVEMPTAV